MIPPSFEISYFLTLILAKRAPKIQGPTKTLDYSLNLTLKNPYLKGFFKDWRPLRDQFLNGSIEFGFSLQRIQTAFTELEIATSIHVQ